MGEGTGGSLAFCGEGTSFSLSINLFHMKYVFFCVCGMAPGRHWEFVGGGGHVPPPPYLCHFN